MPNKKIIAFSLILASIVFLSASAIIIKSGNIIPDVITDALKTKDTFCGYFITTDVFDMNGSDCADERIYGEIIDVKENGFKKTSIRFKGIDGIPMAIVFVKHNKKYNSVGLAAGPEIYSQKTNIGESENLNTYDIEGNIFVKPNSKKMIFFNPVYETSAGKIYMTASDTGYSLSDNFDTKNSETSEILSDGKTKKAVTNIKITIKPVDIPKTIILKQFNNQDEVISTTTIEQNQIPKFITKNENTKYAIAETHSLNWDNKNVVTRKLINMNEDEYKCMFINSEDFGIAHLIKIEKA